MSFAGFDDSVPSQANRTRKPRNGSSNKRQDKLLKAAVERKTMSVVDCSIGSSDGLPVEARLCPAKSSASSPVKLLVTGEGKCQLVSGSDPPKSHQQQTEIKEQITNGNEEKPSSSVQLENEHEKENVIETAVDQSSYELKEAIKGGNKLEIFQEKQRLIEEQNRKRREMLTKVISDRKKKTNQEHRKLEIVQQELQKIDILLNTDVQYLRDSIEQASFEFMKAQKRYEDSEKEYVNAKMHLFGVMEKKELLTDHLCAIIEQNEMRKAKKLNELMKDLDLESPELLSHEDNCLAELRQPADFNTIRKTESVNSESNELQVVPN